MKTNSLRLFLFLTSLLFFNSACFAQTNLCNDTFTVGSKQELYFIVDSSIENYINTTSNSLYNKKKIVSSNTSGSNRLKGVCVSFESYYEYLQSYNIMPDSNSLKYAGLLKMLSDSSHFNTKWDGRLLTSKITLLKEEKALRKFTKAEKLFNTKRAKFAKRFTEGKLNRKEYTQEIIKLEANRIGYVNINYPVFNDGRNFAIVYIRMNMADMDYIYFWHKSGNKWEIERIQYCTYFPI